MELILYRSEGLNKRKSAWDGERGMESYINLCLLPDNLALHPNTTTENNSTLLFPSPFPSQTFSKMRFFQITSALALATAANAAMSASTIQSDIDQITTISSDANEIAESLSVVLD